MPDEAHEAQASRSPKDSARAAGVGVRFAARLLDGMILAVAILIVVTIAGAFVSDDVGAGTWWLVGLVGTLADFGYFVWLESSFGATFGKQFLRLRTVGPNGRKPTTRAAMVRNAWILLGIIPFVGGLASATVGAWIAISIKQNGAGRGVHDRWAGGTAVVRVA